MKRLAWLSSALLAPAIVAMPQGNAEAQSIPLPLPSVRDENNVDLASGGYSASTEVIAIGDPSAGGMAYQRWFDTSVGQWRDNWESRLGYSGDYLNVTLFGVPMLFTGDGTYYSPIDGSAAFLTHYPDSPWVLTLPSGDTGIFHSYTGTLSQYVKASGEVLQYTWKDIAPYDRRIQSVQSSFGYQLKYEYASDTDWDFYKIIAINNTINYCQPEVSTCASTLTKNWPSLTFTKEDSGATTAVTDQAGRTARFTLTQSGSPTVNTLTIRIPASPHPNIVVTYPSNGRVSTLTKGPGTWNYSFSQSGDIWTTTVTDPISNQSRYKANSKFGVLTERKNALNNIWSYTYDTYGRLTEAEQPEGNKTQFAYDATWKNLIQITEVPKSGSGLSSRVTTINYDQCTYYITCTLPTSYIDPLGNRTDLTYETTYGALTSITGPAPSSGAVRPQTRFAYAQPYAWYKNQYGSIVQAAHPINLLVGTSACATTASCAGGADETTTTIARGSSGVANNLLPTATTIAAGNGSLSATTSTTYDEFGNVVVIDGPLSGTDDQTHFRYNDAREVAGVIGPDPDGGGALKRRATRYWYNLNGQVTGADTGAVSGLSDTDWDAFALLSTVVSTYNFNGQKVAEGIFAESLQTYTQWAFDDAGRLQCTAVRLSDAAVQPDSACNNAPTGPDGPDRLQYVYYDAANQLTRVANAMGTGQQQDTLTYTYSANGLIQTLADAAGHLSTIERDGFDREKKLRFPNPSSSGSSTTDYEEYSYNANSMRTGIRLRDGSTLALSYDNLDRQVLLDAPSTSNDVATTYDNFNRVLTQTKDSAALSFAYDQLSRNTSATSPLGAVAYQYDLAGRRTRMTWPDTYYVSYDVNLYGDLTALRENGATSGAGVLATYAFDDFGRRVSVGRGNGVTTTYGYDPASRLASLAHNLSGTSGDYSASFAYNRASQIISRTASDAYAYPYGSAATQNYSANNLNQYTAVAGASITYDGRGNLTSDGTNAFTFDVLNRLITGPSSATLGYDAASRLYDTNFGGGVQRRLYDGNDVIGEYDGSGTLTRRYVHGFGVDEPVVWYEGSNTSDRRWLLPDALGSIVAVTNGSGAATAINKFDAYGRPDSGNVGYFQYTGQGWLSQVSLYNYKARVYAPSLGRFLQTDPVLYNAGPNLYAYVFNDPINTTDPLGLDGSGDLLVNGIPGVPSNGFSLGSIEQALAALAPGAGPQADTGWQPPPEPSADRNLIIVNPNPSMARQRKQGSHHYAVSIPICLCTPDQAFDVVRSFSAPGASYAPVGTRTLRLWLNNPIQQTVDPKSFTITNSTLPDHFFGGQVQITVTNNNGVAVATYVGSGTGPNAGINQVVGPWIFGTLGTAAYLAANPTFGQQGP